MRTIYYLLFALLWPALAAVGDAGFADKLRDANDLCAAGEHEAAVAAWVTVADSEADVDRQFAAISAAARCARLHLRSEARALELCDRLDDETYRLACRAVVYQWMTSPSSVLDDLGGVDLTAWPDSLAATAFMVRAQANYQENNSEQAVDDFVRAYQFSAGREKWAALQRLGDTFLNLMNDEILAEACYRQAMANAGMAWPGLRSRVTLGDLLIEQKRYDDALKVLNVRPGGIWRASMLLGSARAHLAGGDHEQAHAALEEVIKWPDSNSAQRKEAEGLLKELQAAP